MRKWLMAAAVLTLAASSAFAFTTEQAARGQQLFSQHCAGCHGAQGQGGKVPAQFEGMAGWEAPAVVGKGALPERPPASRKVRRTEFRTAADVYQFAKSAMPAQSPGSLSDRDYLDIVAFDLRANGVKPDGRPLTAESAAQAGLPAP